jgi:hypothetical protein
VPSVLRVGGVQLSDAEPVVLDADDTVMVNAASEVDVLPSLTLIWMLLNVPVEDGVPESLPVDVLNVAHDGLFEMLNVSGSLFASLAVGVKLYATPVLAVVEGVPPIFGAEFVVEEPETVMLNVGREALVTPSVAVMMMLENTPVAEGVPESLPVEVLKVAHDGLLRMENVIVLPSGSLAVGWKEYAVPTVAVFAGVPVIVGDAFEFAFTTSEYEGRQTRVVPSVTQT